MTRHSSVIRELREPVLAGPARTAAALRAEAAAGAGPAYVEKVHRHAYRVTDADVTALREAGWSEDELFELTVAAALGAGLARLEAGLRALR